MSPARLAKALLVCSLALLVVSALSLCVGSVHVSLREAWAAWRDPALRPGSVAWEVVVEQRLPRIVLAALVGSGLGLAGAALQAILANPLADPYTLGVSSGSAVGAVVAISLPRVGNLALGPFSSVQAASLLGAAAMVLLIYRLGVRRREFRIEALLLGGVTVALVSSSAIVVIRTMVDPLHLVSVDRWLLGGLAVVGVRDIVSILPLWLAGVAVLLQLASAYNQLALGEEMAFGRGLNPASVQQWTFVAASLVTAAVVSVAGPIGFVGLIVPHALRLVLGPDHRLLLPCAGLVAGAFLIGCDTLARSVLAPTELPVGVVTAVVGGPVFVAMLLRRGEG